MQALDRKDAARDAYSRRFLNKCHARGVLLLNRCILNLATRANPVGRAWLRSDFGAIDIPRMRLFKAAPRLAMRLAASHMTVSQASSAVEHDAVATVLIIGASRGIGLEAVKAALEAAFGACAGPVS